MSALVYSHLPERAALLGADLRNLGWQVQTAGESKTLLDAVKQYLPDVLVCTLSHAENHFFNSTQAIADAAPCPVLVFTDSLDTQGIAMAAASGVHAYVVDAYSAPRLPAWVALTQARFKHESALRGSLSQAVQLLDERKVVDQAKNILMRARQLSDDDAFRLLRNASMHTNLRLAEVSKQLISSAHFADGVNRAGQLRMLSQRLIKLYALQLLQGQVKPSQAFDESLARIDANITFLARGFSQPELALQVKQSGLTWARLKRSLKRAPTAQDMGVADELAELLLGDAERLTGLLQSTGSANPLQVLNRVGRQRMLCQRFAKLALLGALKIPDQSPDLTAMLQTQNSFEQAQHYLNNIPLSTPAISRLLASAKLDWQRLLAGQLQVNRAAGQLEVVLASENLLDVFEQLSTIYEGSMQVLMG